METITPSSFLRVDDKFFPSFILHDAELRQGPALLYVLLFRQSRTRDYCWPSQNTLAQMCKCTERSIQAYLQKLVELQYIRIERCNGHNIYRLLLSPRVQGLLHQYDIALLAGELDPLLAVPENISPTSVDYPKNFRIRHENISYNPRVLRNNNLPPTPLPPQTVETSSPRVSSLAQGGVAFPPPSGRGDSIPTVENTHAKKEVHSRHSPAHAADFEKLYAVWPVKKDQQTAMRIFCSLVRARKLPSLESLLATVKRFACEDKHWKNGCAPLLSTWLRGQRWLDEPYAPEGSLSGVNASPETFPHARPVEQPLPVPPPSLLAAELENTAKALVGLWPKADTASKGKLLAHIGLARLRGVGLDALVDRARAYMQATACYLSWSNGLCHDATHV